LSDTRLHLQARLAQRGVSMPVVCVTGHGDVGTARRALKAGASAKSWMGVVAGRHNREIAADIGIGPRTVEAYKARLMDKLDVRRVADLVRLALEAQVESGR
jgi:FixJ family two-component response regulator